MNGIVLGTLIILFGAIISWFTGMLLISCYEETNARGYEELALVCFGEVCEKVIGWMLILTCLGFAISYTLFIKDLIPQLITIVMYGSSSPDFDPLPNLFGKGQYSGKVFWASAYFLLALFPMSLS
jgi:amino acid permease